MTKYFTTLDDEPVQSIARVEAFHLPPVSFVGELEAGLSGKWSPPHNILLVNGFITASAEGSAVASLAIMKQISNDRNADELLLECSLAANDTKSIFYFDNSVISKTLTPYEQIYVASFIQSNHVGLTVQMFAERV